MTPGDSDPSAVSATTEEGRRARLTARYTQLAQSKRMRPLAAVVKRFQEIEGIDLGLLISLELFTTIIPLMILGYAFANGSDSTLNPATVLIENFGIQDPLTQVIDEAFAPSSEVASVLSVGLVLGFLFWGIPMSITVASMYAKAWRREQFPPRLRLLRGSTWFLLYLAMLSLRQTIEFAGDPSGIRAIAQFLISLMTVWAFWSVTPLLLVRDGGRGPKFLIIAGLAGVLIEGILIPLGSRLFFPSLLQGMSIFGPIGVAMAILTWSATLGIGWVVTACTSAVWWERTAPAETVIEAQDGVPEGSEALERPSMD